MIKNVCDLTEAEVRNEIMDIFKKSSTFDRGKIMGYAEAMLYQEQKEDQDVLNGKVIICDQSDLS